MKERKKFKMPPRSAEHTRKISEANKGKIPWNLGLIGWTKGTRAGFQKGHKGFVPSEAYARAAIKKSGSGSGTWVGGRWKYWSKQAKIRDDYTCKSCSLRDPEIMEVDHIRPKCDFPELKYCLENLVVLCPNCHRRKTNQEITIRSVNRIKNENKV